jgi:hypothetical protein
MPQNPIQVSTRHVAGRVLRAVWNQGPVRDGTTERTLAVRVTLPTMRRHGALDLPRLTERMVHPALFPGVTASL